LFHTANGSLACLNGYGSILYSTASFWPHSGFNVYCAPTIWPNNDKGLDDLARYIIRACFSQERMTYLPAKDTLDGQAKVIFRSKDGRTSKTFEALDWLAQLVTHIPNKGEQMVRYYGYYSNKSRGMRKRAGTDDQVPALVESAVSSAAFKGLFNGAIPSSGHTIMMRSKFAVSGYRNRTNASFSVAGNNGSIMVVRHNCVIHNILY
jgi:hypothetical protein